MADVKPAVFEFVTTESLGDSKYKTTVVIKTPELPDVTVIVQVSSPEGDKYVQHRVEDQLQRFARAIQMAVLPKPLRIG